MTPLDQAAALCSSLGYDFDAKVREFAREGYAYLGQDCVILAQARVDTWWVWLAVGPGCLQRFCALAPYPLPYVAFAREAKGDDETRLIPFDRVLRFAKLSTPWAENLQS